MGALQFFMPASSWESMEHFFTEEAFGPLAVLREAIQLLYAFHIYVDTFVSSIMTVRDLSELAKECH